MSRTPTTFPLLVTPMLAHHAPAPFHRPGWLYEVKEDGYRIMAYKQGRRVHLISRNGLDWTERFSDVAQAILRTPARTLILDGEVVVCDKSLVSRIDLLQDGNRPLIYMAFDCLFNNGRDLRREPLTIRREALESVVDGIDHLFPARRLASDGLTAFEEVLQRGCEGLVAKDPQSCYVAGRSSAWMKVKQRQDGEFVIGGYTGKTGIASLLVGLYQDHGLRYVGEVELGMRAVRHSAVIDRIPALTTAESPFMNVKRMRRAVWLRPHLVAAVSYQEWLRGYLRHACYRGLRIGSRPAGCTMATTRLPSLHLPPQSADP